MTENKKALSRGLRNNNPGNIMLSETRYRGETDSGDSAFKRFESMPLGYRAMFVLLYTYQKRYGLNTIEGMIVRYAPPFENNTVGYAGFVVRRSGIGLNEPIDTLCREQMVAVVSAMSRVENGVDAVAADVEEGWDLFEKYRP